MKQFTCSKCQKQFANNRAIAGHKRMHGPSSGKCNRIKQMDILPEIQHQRESLFIQNWYYTTYFNIIDQAKKRKSFNEYSECHHIIPKCLGGNNSRSNLVNLTAREHFICHMLLPKMVDGESNFYHKLIKAAIGMKRNSNSQSRYMNSKLYEFIRINHSKNQKIKQSGSLNNNYGKTWMNLPNLNISKPIKNDKIAEYLEQGWFIGQRSVNNFKIIKDKKRLRQPSENKKQYANDLFLLFKTSNCSLRNFIKQGCYNKSYVSLHKLFKTYVNNYSKGGSSGRLRTCNTNIGG